MSRPPFSRSGPARQRGFSLFEIGVVLLIALAITAGAVVMGRQANDQARNNAVISAVAQIVGEIRRIYTDSSTGYTGVTPANVMTRGGNLIPIWNPTASFWVAGGADINVINTTQLPNGATGTNADGFLIDVSPTDAAMCRALVQAYSKQTSAVSAMNPDGSAYVILQTTTGPVPAATTEAACNTGAPRTVRLFFN